MRVQTTIFLLLASPALAQDITTPGMPVRSGAQPEGRESGQTDRFSNEFNPSIGGVLDAVADHVDPEDGEDGFDMRLRALELSTNAWIDPNTWGYAVLRGDSEEFELEEAAVHYSGFDGNSTLRAGRFFVDFGKQMQAHEHDLPYPERPAVLREYLGAELAGTGLQYDYWAATGDEGAVRFSLGLFDSLLGGHGHGGHGGHGEEEEEEEGAEIHMGDRTDLDSFHLTARLTGFHDVGDSGVFQWGLSARQVPNFAFEFEASEAEVEDLSNNVLGLDLTYGITDEIGLSGWTFGGEALMYSGDIGAEVVDVGNDGDASNDTLEILDDDVFGNYLWVERVMNERDSMGVLFSSFEHPEEEKPEDSELTLYYTRKLTEASRLRFALTQMDSDEEGDTTAFTIQFTNFFGPHLCAHGVNW